MYVGKHEKNTQVDGNKVTNIKQHCRKQNDLFLSLFPTQFSCTSGFELNDFQFESYLWT